MSTTIAGMRPDPRIRQAQLDELIATYRAVARRKQGAIVFLAGQAGSGCSATLAVERPHPVAFAVQILSRRMRDLLLPVRLRNELRDYQPGCRRTTSGWICWRTRHRCGNTRCFGPNGGPQHDKCG